MAKNSKVVQLVPAAPQPTQSVRRLRSRVRIFERTPKQEEDNSSAIEKAMKSYASQRIEDPYAPLYGVNSGKGAGWTMVKPTYVPEVLLRIPNESSILRQCIDAYVINIESYGARLEYIGPEGQEDTPQSVAHKAKLQAMIDKPNFEYSLIELRQRTRRDYESLGYFTMEITRDKKGQIGQMFHIPAHTMRMTVMDREQVEVEVPVIREGKVFKTKSLRRFRRFVQQVGSDTIYFKEFGDPRMMESKTGQYKDGLPENEQATEIYFGNQYTPNDLYGLPRWVGQLPLILGLRESEMNNMQFFKDNAIPALVVAVAGGMLTDDAFEQLTDKFTRDRGRAAANKVLVLEASADQTAASADGKLTPPKIEIKPLAGERQSDQQFGEYEIAAAKKIRSAFRLPPIFVGLSEDLTHATAQASMLMAEGQVFGPERNKVDEIYNQHFFVVDGAPSPYWQLRSLPPRITNPEDVLKALEALDKVGALTPNVAIGIANELFDLEIQDISQEWGSYPFEMVKRMMDKATFDFVSGKFTLIESDPGTMEGGDGATIEGEAVETKRLDPPTRRRRRVLS